MQTLNSMLVNFLLPPEDPVSHPCTWVQCVQCNERAIAHCPTIGTERIVKHSAVIDWNDGIQSINLHPHGSSPTLLSEPLNKLVWYCTGSFESHYVMGRCTTVVWLGWAKL